MTFWKVSDTRMNCLITEAEIAALGYSLEDLTQDRERTEEFLNLLLKKGKEVLGLNTDNGFQRILSLAGDRQHQAPVRKKCTVKSLDSIVCVKPKNFFPFLEKKNF